MSLLQGSRTRSGHQVDVGASNVLDTAQVDAHLHFIRIGLTRAWVAVKSQIVAILLACPNRLEEIPLVLMFFMEVAPFPTYCVRLFVHTDNHLRDQESISDESQIFILHSRELMLPNTLPVVLVDMPGPTADADGDARARDG